MDNLKDILIRLRDEGAQILQTGTQNLDRGWALLERWQNRCSQTIKIKISSNEYEKFLDATGGVYLNDPYRNFVEEIKAKIYYLDALIEDLEKNPEFYFSKGNKKNSHKTDILSLSSFNKIMLLFDRFHIFVRQLRNRYNNRSTIIINDEYDVQDILHSLLRIFFNDIRPEESTPSYAGKSSRMDFLIKEESTVIEVKKIRSGLDDKEIGKQLIEDIARYKSHPECKTLICFVYDPDEIIKNPTGLESDLSKEENGFTVKVIVRPRRI